MLARFLFELWFFSSFILGLINIMTICMSYNNRITRLNIIMALYGFHVSIIAYGVFKMVKLFQKETIQNFLFKDMGELK